MKSSLKSPDGFSEMIEEIAEAGADLVAGLELWARDGGFESPEEAIRRFRLLQAACAHYYRVYCDLEKKAHQCLGCPAAAIPPQ